MWAVPLAIVACRGGGCGDGGSVPCSTAQAAAPSLPAARADGLPAGLRRVPWGRSPGHLLRPVVAGRRAGRGGLLGLDRAHAAGAPTPARPGRRRTSRRRGSACPIPTAPTRRGPAAYPPRSSPRWRQYVASIAPGGPGIPDGRPGRGQPGGRRRAVPAAVRRLPRVGRGRWGALPAAGAQPPPGDAHADRRGGPHRPGPDAGVRPVGGARRPAERRWSPTSAISTTPTTGAANRCGTSARWPKAASPSWSGSALLLLAMPLDRGPVMTGDRRGRSSTAPLGEGRHDRRDEVVVAAGFWVAAAAAVGLAVVYWRGGQPQAEGALLAVGAGGLAVGIITWAHRLLPAGPGGRGAGGSSRRRAADRAVFDADLSRGGVISRRRLILRSLGAAAVAFGAALLFPLALARSRRRTTPSSTPARGRRASGWSTPTASPVQAADVPLGGLVTVFPEGAVNSETRPGRAGPRRRPGLIRPLPGREQLVAGRPDRLLEGVHPRRLPGRACTRRPRTSCCAPATSRPSTCSTGPGPIFGPAAARLPQLPLAIDADGVRAGRRRVQRAARPSFWNRRTVTRRRRRRGRRRRAVAGLVVAGCSGHRPVDAAHRRLGVADHRRGVVADVRAGGGGVRHRRRLHHLGHRSAAGGRGGEGRLERRRLDRLGRHRRPRGHPGGAGGHHGRRDRRAAPAVAERPAGSRSSPSGGGGMSPIPTPGSRRPTRSTSRPASRSRSGSTPTT